ncbi:hypothetical protein CBL_04116 [Carabus blaptoides fortunei]
MSFKIVTLCLACFVIAVHSNAAVSRSSRRIHLPFLGLGPTCVGCPPHFCDDDPAVIHGYCCGCAGYFDRLPVACPGFLQCPLDGSGLCRDYEYMMNCCC